MDQAPGHLRQPQWTLAVLALLIVVLAAGVWRLHSDAGVDALAPSDPAATALADRAQARFGVAESIAIIYDGLLPGDALRAEVLAEIERLGATNVVVLGGPNAVSDAAAALTPCSGDAG